MKFFIFVVVCNVIGFIGLLHSYIRYKKDCNVSWKYKPLLKKELIEKLNFWEGFTMIIEMIYGCMGGLDLTINGFEFNLKAYLSWIFLAALVNGAIIICEVIFSLRLITELSEERRCNLSKAYLGDDPPKKNIFRKKTDNDKPAEIKEKKT